MNQKIIKTISEELNVRVHQIEAVLSLLEEGNTVPFIARYRKEKTGALDEDQIRTIDKYYQYQVNLLKRKEDVIRLIDEKGMLNEKLKTDILKATQLSEVEDLYRPYKKKKKTKRAAGKPAASFIIAAYQANDALLSRDSTNWTGLSACSAVNTSVCVDYIMLVSLRNSLVRALTLTCSTANALVRNYICHN